MEIPEIMSRLAEPFDPGEVKFKPAIVKGERALALAYVDARVVQDRLDEVLGAAGWQDEYECLPDGSVVCSLRVKVDGEWIKKVDVGSPSEQPDGGDRMKAAFSDALKRAAVKFGIGRYLYRLPSQWCDYDPQKRQFKVKPVLAQAAVANAQGKAHKDLDAIRARGLAILKPAAQEGIKKLEMAWKAVSVDIREACKNDLPELKEEANRANCTPTAQP